MYAVVEDRHQQYRVAPGDRVLIALCSDLEPGSTMTFDKVCAIGGEDGGRVGTPYVEGVSVKATVLGTVKGDKLRIQKLRRRKNSRKRTGFRARYTQIRVEAIES